MTNRKACEDLQAAWDQMSPKWSAEVKSRYFAKIYLPLLEEAEGVYKRNDDLEDYARNCLSALGVRGGNG